MFFRVILSFLLVLAIAACDSSTVEDALDLAEGIPRRQIDVSIVGTNAFANDQRFGSINDQYLEVRDVLGLNYVRVLFGWDDNVQPSPGASPNFSFYDDIASGIPAGVDALVVLTGVPSWMNDPSNWIDGDPRKTFIERWVRPAAQRYGSRARIVGFQIWNEPNMPPGQANPNGLMGFFENPANYLEALALGYSVVQDVAPGKLVLNAATTAINQNYPGSLDYNKELRDLGGESFVDVWAVHYYGRQFENVVRSGGVRSFLNSLNRPIWITETGAQGFNNQLAYAEQVWPYLTEQINGIERIYQYQFTDSSPADISYGLQTLDPSFPVSDLYIHLRDRAAGLIP